jgi:hypothetical protein
VHLRLLAVPEDGEREEAHQPGGQLRGHGAERQTEVALGMESDEDEQIIDDRLAAWRSDPHVGSSWDDVRRRIERK